MENQKGDDYETALFPYTNVSLRFQVLEITFLVASYINTVVAQRGLNLELRKDKPRSESNPLGNRGSVLLWDMESFG